MELLIIFIVIMILSSIMRSLKGAARQDKPAAPPFNPADLFGEAEKRKKAPDTTYSAGDEERPFAWLEGSRERGESRREAEDFPSGTGGGEQPYAPYYAEEPVSPQTPVHSKKRKRAPEDPLPSERSPGRKRDLQQSWSEEQRRSQIPSTWDKRPSHLEGDLENLLTGKRLPLGILASEVLSAPRSKKPYRSLRRG